MKKNFFLFLFMISFSVIQAQLEDGSIAPDFTATDLDGNTWNLYEILDQGKSVVLDFSTTWCAPCWNYHQTGYFKTVYEEYGPNGTDEMMVFFIEADQGTNTACLYDLEDCNIPTQGNWVEGTPYPIIEGYEIGLDYQVGNYPTIIHICPTRSLTQIGQVSADELYAGNSNCPSPVGENNVYVFDYQGFEGSFCDSETFVPSVAVQNLGVNDISSFTVELFNNEQLIESIIWDGHLPTHNTTYIDFSELTITDNAALEIRVETVNDNTDDDLTNNNVTASATLAIESDDPFITLEVFTDLWAFRIYWDIRDENGTVLYYGGNRRVIGIDDPEGGYFLSNSLFTTDNIVIPTDGCYEFTIYDEIGDGLCCDFGEGYFRLLESDGTVLYEGGEFRFTDVVPLHFTGTSVIENNASIAPNSYSGEGGWFCDDYAYSPEISILNLGSNEITSATIDVFDQDGVIYTQDWTGNIQPKETATVTLNEVSFSDDIDLKMEITHINNLPDIYDFDNIDSTSFDKNLTNQHQLDLELALDVSAYENYWQITNSSDELIAFGGNELVGPDGGGAQVAAWDDPTAYGPYEMLTIPLDLPATNECYKFLIVDDWGAGLTGDVYARIVERETGEVVYDLYLAEWFTTKDFLFEVNAETSSTIDFKTVNALSVSPNPTNDLLKIDFDLLKSATLKVEIVDVLGRIVNVVSDMPYAAGHQSIQTSVANVDEGIYFVNITNGSFRITEKFMVIK